MQNKVLNICPCMSLPISSWAILNISKIAKDDPRLFRMYTSKVMETLLKEPKIPSKVCHRYNVILKQNYRNYT